VRRTVPWALVSLVLLGAIVAASLSVSLGPTKTPTTLGLGRIARHTELVPSVVGLTISKAERRAFSWGALSFGYGQIPLIGAHPNVVVRQFPRAGTRVPTGTSIQVLVGVSYAATAKVSVIPCISVGPGVGSATEVAVVPDAPPGRIPVNLGGASAMDWRVTGLPSLAVPSTLSRSLLKCSGGHSVFRLLPDRTPGLCHRLM